MGKYRKLVAALVGLVVLIGLNYYDLSVPMFSPIVSELVIGALTAWGVYQVPNDVA